MHQHARVDQARHLAEDTARRRPGPGRLYAGTSGFAYPAWTPAFYPPGTRADGYLRHYATILSTCELSSTYRRLPDAPLLARWAALVPAHFRFALKLHAATSLRAYAGDAASVERLLEPMPALGHALGTALFRVPAGRSRDDVRLDRLLAAWPASIPVAFELQDPSWMDDEVHDRLRAAGAVLVATETDDAPDPPLLLTGAFLYVRLRRATYDDATLDTWAARLEPFLAAGHDAFAMFRHDEVGAAPGWALALAGRLPRFAARPDR
jgi:uncharacterized protein YecE (DUF72 family)